MRAVVFGTSNSLMTKGWLNLVRDEARGQDIHIDNRSIGGSSSRYGAYLTAALPAEPDYDAILYDYAIPDAMLLESGHISDRDILGHYLTIGQELIRRDALDRALVLLLPRQTELLQSEMLHATCALLSDLGIPFLDCRPLLVEIMAETGLTPEEVYLDPRHFAPEIQLRLGRHVLRHLNDRARRATPAPAQPTPGARALAAMPPAGYRRLDMIAPDARAPREYGSSVVSFPALELRNGDSLKLSGAKYLIGALIWTHDAAGSVTIYGRQAGIKLHLRRAFRNIFLFDSLTVPLELGEEARAVAVNDRKTPYQWGLGLSTTRYDHEGATSEIVLLLGCDIPPAQYHAMFTQAERRAPAETPPPRFTRFLRSLLRRRG